jgi:hypothetical protein
MNSICGLCDGEFPPEHAGSSIGGVTWYCDQCTEKNNIAMEGFRKARKEYLTHPSKAFLIKCRGCDEGIVLMKRDIVFMINKMDDRDFDLCPSCKAEII